MEVLHGGARASRRVVFASALAIAFALAAGGTGCAWRTGGPDAPVALQQERAPTDLTLEALRRTQAFYLHPERIDGRMLSGALDALELRFDSVRFDEATGVLEVGRSRAVVPVWDGFELERFRSLLGRALYFVGAHLQEPLEEGETLQLVALNGALAALDRYSTVFSGRGTEDFRIRFSGKLQGIGARIGRRDGHLTAVTVFPGSPAEKGGLKDGDALRTIDGDPTQPLSVGEAVGRIRGEPGSPVVLGVLRGERELDVSITRGEVAIPSVEAKLRESGVGYARIFSVSRATAREFRTKVQELGLIDGLILDLRGNSGGSMSASAQLADFFLSQSLIMRVVNRNREPHNPQSRRVANPDVIFHFPVTVLVDPMTASAAEILSGAIAPLERVHLMGQTTFGKGVIQQVMPMPGENLLKITVGEYLLSSDRVVHETGIDPDTELFPVPDSMLSRLAHVPEGAIPYIRQAGEDDTFPTEAAEILLSHAGPDPAAEIRQRALGGIAEQLVEHGIAFEPPRPELPGDILPLEVRVSAPDLRAGEAGTVQIDVRNPNEVAIPNLWLAAEAPVAYLQNKLVALGTLPPGGLHSATLEVTPPEGLSAPEHPFDLYLASGSQPLQKEPVRLTVEARVPELVISVEPLPDQRIRVRVENRGEHGAGTFLIGVPGATRSFEALDPGASEEVELQLTANPDDVSVTLAGPWARRRIAIPIPSEATTVSPPALDVEPAELEGRPTVRITARDPGGLERAWLTLDGQKALYVAWGGEAEGSFGADLPTGRAEVGVKIRTQSGVSVLDVREFGQDPGGDTEARAESE